MKVKKTSALNSDSKSITVPMRNKCMQEYIAEQISDWIMEGTLQSGDRLIESDLAEKFGVSRIPVREAIKTLEARGLVEVVPFVGISVKKYEVEEIREIYILRQHLETFALRIATESISEEEINMLDQMCDELEARISTKPEPSIEVIKWYYQHNFDFHMLIYKATGMTKLVQIITNLWDNIAFFRIRNVRKEGYAEQMLKEHRFYVDCLKERNGETLARNYADNLQNHISSFIDNNSL